MNVSGDRDDGLDYGTGRDPVVAGHGMISTGHPLATAAGFKVLRDGGNAFDAIVCAAAVIAVVEPNSNQVGGDVFALCRPASGDQVEAVNASGPAPAQAELAAFTEGIPEVGPAAASVPGAVSAWDTILERYGTITLADALAPAIEYAEAGFPADLSLCRTITAAQEWLRKYPASAEAFLIDGEPPRAGQAVRQSDLAETLRQIAADGAPGFYRGAFAQALVRAAADGGLFGSEDLADYACEILPPLRSFYRGFEVLGQPLVSQGFVLLEELNIAEGFDLGGMQFGSVDAVHILVECKKLAFADRHGHIGDPKFVDAPVEPILTKEYAAKRRMALDPARASGRPSAGDPSALGGDTTALSAVDERGNAVSFIQSVFASFGSRYVVPGTGVLLNNRMRGFSLDPESPNVLAPGKRPVHTLNTYMVLDEGRIVLLGGSPGAHYQVQANLQVISNVIDHEMHWQEALDAPRWYHNEDTNELLLEARFDHSIGTPLRQRGHEVSWQQPFTSYARSQGIMIDPASGAFFGATDPRWHGQVLGY